MTRELTALTTGGHVAGKAGPGHRRFCAVPYAKAPVGRLRWAPASPVCWDGTRDATRPGPIAPQLPSRLSSVMGDFALPQSEDCLHLTVWTPAKKGQRLPVVIWLHGGAWQSGAGALDWYDGERLAAQGGVVVVAPNYRLGALGWLAGPGQVANLGLLDQEAAIAWVVANAEAFGGDPERITVMGQSAGASSIACLLMRRPLFRRAIVQSASLGRGFRTAEEAAALADAFMDAIGAPSLEAARAVEVEKLLTAQNSPQVRQQLSREGSGRSTFAPVLDGQVLPLDGERGLKLALGRADVLVGYTRDEMAAFGEVVSDAPGARPSPGSERIFGAPARAWAAEAVAQGRQAWAYRFDHGDHARFGACHCIELPFVFGTAAAFHGAPMLQGFSPADRQRLTREVQAAWLAFIHGGAPPWAQSPHLHIFS